MVMAHNPEVFVMLTTLYTVLSTFSLLNRMTNAQTSNFNVMCNLVAYQPTMSPSITLSISAIQVKEPY